jgi:hypothetical protein
MGLSSTGLVVGSYMPFWQGFSGRQLFAFLLGDYRQLCAFLVGIWWQAVMCPSSRLLLVGSYVPFW